MYVDGERNNTINFSDKELSLLNKLNPTMYSIVEWVMNNPEIKHGRKRIIKNTTDEIWFSSNYDRCPIASIIGQHCSRNCNYCGGFVCGVKHDGKNPHIDSRFVSCLEFRWKDIINGNTEQYSHLSIEARNILFDCKPIVSRQSITVI